MDGENDFGLHGSRTELIGRLAAEARVVVAGVGFEVVRVARLAARSDEGKVDADVVLEPDDLRQRVAAARHAHQVHLLAHPHRLAFRVAQDFRRTRRICWFNTEKNRPANDDHGMETK